MGAVWEAVRESDGARVAVKLLHGDRQRSERALERFRREAHALGRLDHPAIVPVLEARFDHEPPYMVMPYVEGRPLWDLVRGVAAAEPESMDYCVSTLPELDGARDVGPSAAPWVRAVTRIGRDLAEALAVAHARAVVHRDLKPGNVLLGPDGRVHLLDFGLVADETAATVALTLSSERLGTPLYMSPEQVVGAPSADHRVDSYSLGITLIEALTLQAPFATRDLAGLYRSVVEDDPLRVARQCPALGDGLMSVLEAAVRKDPRDRYQDAGAFARDLERVLVGREPDPPVVPLRRRVVRFAGRHVRSAGILGTLLLLSMWISTALGRPGRPDDTARMLALADDAARGGGLRLAADYYNDVVARSPGDERAVTGLRSVARQLGRRADRREAGFRYEEAAQDLEVLRSLDPEGVDPARLSRLRSGAFGTLEVAARTILSPTAPLGDRLRVVEQLQERSAEFAVPPGERERLLVRLLELPELHPGLAAALMELVSRFRVSGAEPALTRLMNDAGVADALRTQAAVTLAALEVEAGRRFLRTVAQGDGPASVDAFRRLCEVAHEDSVPLFLDVLEEEDRSLWRPALMGLSRAPLGSLGGTVSGRVGDVLARVLPRVNDLEAGLDGVTAAGRLPGEQGISLLVRLMKDGSQSDQVRSAAAQELGERGGPTARAALLDVLGADRSRQVRGAAALALRPQTPPAVAELLRVAQGDPDEDVRARAFIALGRGRTLEALEPALKALRSSPDVRARVGAILSLGLLRQPDSEAVKLLTEMLRPGRHPHERLSAAWALGRLREPRVLPALVTVLKQESLRVDPRERATAALAGAGSGLAALLGQLGDDVGAMMGLLPGMFSGGATAAEPAAAVAFAIAELVAGADERARGSQTERAMDALLDAARGARRQWLRVAAVTALGRVPGYGARSLPVLRELRQTASGRRSRRALALALTRLGDREAGEEWLLERPQDGEDALTRSLILLRLGRQSEARAPFLAAVRLGIVDQRRLAMEPEFRVLAQLADVLGL